MKRLSLLVGLALGCGSNPPGGTPVSDGLSNGPAPSDSDSNAAAGSAGSGSTDGPGSGEIPMVDLPLGPQQPPIDDPTKLPPGETLDPASCEGFYVMEALDRGVVAMLAPGGIYVGWRMFGHEYSRDEPERIRYDVYRDGERIANVTGSTNYLDTEAVDVDFTLPTYSVAVVRDGVAEKPSDPVETWTQNYLRVPLQRPGDIYDAHNASVGDVDGDGTYEIFLLWQPNNAQDNANGGVTDDVFIDALRLDGTVLWRINLGPNIRAGEHYTQFIVIDADGDGRAELGVKTAPGTRDGTGAFLSLGPAEDDNDMQVFRNANGYVLSGPEYFTVFEGLTGKELATEPYHVLRGNVGAWGDTYGNRVDRFLGTAAYLDDTGLPSFVMARGYYTRTTLGAWNFRDGALTQHWLFDSDQTPRDAGNRPFTGQGAHSLSVANADGDRGQEIIYGAMTVDHDGNGKCSTGLNHGDALHVGDFILDRPGLEVFMPAEDTSRPRWHLNDPGTCEIIHQSPSSGADVGRGVAADVLASNPGAEFWVAGSERFSSAATGAELPDSPRPQSVNFLVWWDADELRELENGTSITKPGGGVLQACNECAQNGGTKSVPTLLGDLFGDWREEVMWREADNSALRIYTTTAVTERRIYTLMHDPQYRVAISWQNVAYNQPPHPSFHIGPGMAPPPEPDIRMASCPRTALPQ